MAVVKATETFGGRSGSKDMRKVEYVRIFVVVTDDQEDDASVVRNAVTIPRIAQGHPNDQVWAWCNRIDCQQRDDSPLVWDVTVEYTTDPGEYSQSSDPLQQPPVVQWSVMGGNEEFLIDELDRPVLNSALVPFDPAPTRQMSYPVCAVTMNERPLHQERLMLVPSVNGPPFLGLAPGAVMLSNMSADFTPHGISGYWKVTYEFKFNMSLHGWDPPLLDAGYMEWKPINPEANPEDPTTEWDHFPIMVRQRTLVDADDPDSGWQTQQVETPEPVLLNGRGRKLDPKLIHEGRRWWAHYQRYRRVSYRAWGLEQFIRATLQGSLPIPYPP